MKKRYYATQKLLAKNWRGLIGIFVTMMLEEFGAFDVLTLTFDFETYFHIF